MEKNFKIENPLVSVIIPTHDRKEYVVKAINSVLSQTYKNIEIIIIDDCSTDGTHQVISDLCKQNNRIFLIKNSVNLGPAESANRGIDCSRGKYIAILDDDDVWCEAKKLQKQVSFLETHVGHVLVGGGVIRVSKEGKELSRYLPIEHDNDIRKAILIDNVFAHSTVLFTRESWKQAQGYQKDLQYFADWDLWLKLGKLGSFYNFQEFFCYYLDQQHGKNRNSHDYKIRRRLLANIGLRKKYKQYYPGYAKSILLCFANYVYSFLPFRTALRPTLDAVRNVIFGPPPYKYVKPK